ncbi:MAG: class I SAM-dependent RNA methyltransferase [Clostridia bacterium]|nr:class I SAM-dependent RNA methyltransferase [Clostridia bacterium]
MSERYTFFATAAFGLEGLCKRELIRLGFSDARAEMGGVRFTADWSGAFRACLWLSCADRVLLILAEGDCVSFEELFQLVRKAPLSHILPRDAAVPVTGRCARSRLMSVRDCQAITKKAVAEHMRGAYGLERMPETGPVYRLDIGLHGDRARLTLDLCGDALNRRGYRTWNGEAPLRETAAAALVSLSGWRGDTPLHDPCCGTGTILIEAAFRAARRAPGLTRDFDMEAWPCTAGSGLPDIRREAREQYDPSRIPAISGSDISEEALELARRHIRQAGMEGCIRVFRKDLRDLQLEQENVYFLTNPPYGERLGDRNQCESLYRAMKPLLQRHPGSRLGIITSHAGFERIAGMKALKKTRLYNGRLECNFMTFGGRQVRFVNPV